MANMKVTPKKDAKGNITGVTLDIDFGVPRRSASGKTLVDFSTRGNKPLDLGNETDYYAGINIYHYPE